VFDFENIIGLGTLLKDKFQSYRVEIIKIKKIGYKFVEIN